MTPDAQPVKARAVLRDTGQLRRITVVDSGCIYSKFDPPKVAISPPPNPKGRQATAEAVLDGKGGIKDVVITDPGTMYRSDVPVRVMFLVQAEVAASRRARMQAMLATCLGPARAVAVVDREVSRVEVVEGGSGYVVPMGVEVKIEPPVAVGGEADGRPARATAVLTAAATPNMITPR